jgi:hypothetical protein
MKSIVQSHGALIVFEESAAKLSLTSFSDLTTTSKSYKEPPIITHKHYYGIEPLLLLNLEKAKRRRIHG